jgi:MFS family permease
MKLGRTTTILLIASSLWYFGEGLFGPLFAIYAEKIGGDMLDITWAWSIYLICTGLFYGLVGRMLMRSRFKAHVMVFGYGLNAILTLCYLLVHNTNQLFVVQIGLGIAEALSTPVWDELFASNLDEQRNTFHWSLASGHSHFVSGIAIAIGGLIAHYISFHALFILMGCVQTIATIIQSKLAFSKSE